MIERPSFMGTFRSRLTSQRAQLAGSIVSAASPELDAGNA